MWLASSEGREDSMNSSIPKYIHYCWFGKKPKPSSVELLIRGWTQALPDYEIKEWNEQSFDISAWPYASQAYAAGRYAFVSDVARLHALYTCGGVYLDTDVEVKRSFDDLLDGSIVLGFEEGNYVATSTIVAPAGSRLIGDFLDGYRSRSFQLSDGSLDQTTNVEVLTAMLEGAGLIKDGSPQEISWFGEQVKILDRRKFSPIDYPNGINHADDTTYAIHLFGHSWGGPVSKIKSMARKALIGIIGGRRLKRLRELIASRL